MLTLMGSELIMVSRKRREAFRRVRAALSKLASFIAGVIAVIALTVSPLPAIVLLVLLVLFGIRFCQLRWTATKRVYEYFLLVQRHGAPGATPESHAE